MNWLRVAKWFCITETNNISLLLPSWSLKEVKTSFNPVSPPLRLGLEFVALNLSISAKKGIESLLPSHLPICPFLPCHLHPNPERTHKVVKCTCPLVPISSNLLSSLMTILPTPGPDPTVPTLLCLGQAQMRRRLAYLQPNDQQIVVRLLSRWQQIQAIVTGHRGLETGLMRRLGGFESGVGTDTFDGAGGGQREERVEDG